MAFVVEKEVKLDDLGHGWEGASIFMNALSFRETEELASLSSDVDPQNPSAESNKSTYNAVSELLQRKFVRGRAYNGVELVELKASDVVDLPLEVVNNLVKALSGSGTVSPN